jgi:U4/U6.U5 tri-snRNP-associated protein 2
VDLPPVPIFKDSDEERQFPQVPLTTLLRKFDGSTETVENVRVGTVRKSRYILESTPDHLIFHIKRFETHFKVKEMNHTIVNFPLKALDLSSILQGWDCKEPVLYDLVGSVVHESKAMGKTDERDGGHSGSFKAHILHRMTGEWYQIEDLRKTELHPHQLAISEAYILVYARRCS